MTLASFSRRFLSGTLLLAATHASSQTLNDPANLAGERVSPPALADTLPINHGAAALQQLLLKIRTRASLMLIVAHPDDEDGGMLTYESRGQGARVATLTLTRGEGGQNLMSADFDDALGLIRTQELLAADRYFGADQFFGTEVDFGFSKTREETLSKWTHDRVLYDAVRCVRLYRPLVLASVFVGGVTDGHGHHQVAGEIAQEVFLAAADPNIFPEMHLPPWAPLKVYARVPFFPVTAQGMFDYATGKYAPPLFHNYVTGKDITHEPVATVLIHEGERSTALGMNGDTYVQFARRGLALQKTQIGAGVRLAPTGAYDVAYTLMASRICPPSESKPASKSVSRPASGLGMGSIIGCPILSSLTGKGGVSGSSPTVLNTIPEQGLFENIDTSLPSLATLAPAAPPSIRLTLTEIDHNLTQAQHLFNPDHLERTTPPLREALRTLDALLSSVEAASLDPDQKFNLLHELRIKRVQLNDALVLALGLDLRPSLRNEKPIAAQPANLVARQTFRVDANSSSNLDPRFNGRLFDSAWKIRFSLKSAPGLLFNGLLGELNTTLSAEISAFPPPTKPYFVHRKLEDPFYTLTDPTLRNAPATPAPLVEATHILYQGVALEMQRIVEAPAPSPPAATVAVPALSVQLSPALGIMPLAAKNDRIPVNVVVKTTIANATGYLHLQAPANWRVEPATVKLTLAHPGDEQRLAFTLIPPSRISANQSSTISAIAESGGHLYTEGFRPVGYPGLTSTNYYTPATYRVTAVDVNTPPDLKVAYLSGTGDAVPEYLPNLGITPTILTPKDLTAATLKQYDAVLLGVRAYNAQPALAGAPSAALLDYARGGGIVVAQYNTGDFPAHSLPYPLEIPGDPGHNVVVEADPVRILAPASPLLTWPNRLTSADFDGWVEERGHGFAASFDPHYQALLETHDPDQDPQRGGLLLAPVGRGAYIYCALALYRQLPEGVPGAYRLFANLLSLARNPAFTSHR